MFAYILVVSLDAFVLCAGESDNALVETLTQMEAPPSSISETREREGEGDGEGEGEGEGGGGGGGEGSKEALDSPAQLDLLRKLVLRSVQDQLHRVEIAGGMRAICFMKVCMLSAFDFAYEIDIYSGTSHIRTSVIWLLGLSGHPVPTYSN